MRRYLLVYVCWDGSFRLHNFMAANFDAVIRDIREWKDKDGPGMDFQEVYSITLAR